MKKAVFRRSLCALGAMVGAGFASGRELQSFFADQGRWGYAGALTAGAACAWLLSGAQDAPQGRWARMLPAALCIAAGGAMLACGGELAALMLPLRRADVLGIVCLAALAYGAKGREGALPGGSLLLVLLLGGMLAAGWLRPGTGTALTTDACSPLRAILRGLCYGGFNAALAAQAWRGDRMEPESQRQAACLTGGLLTALVWIGCRVLARHPECAGEALPMVRLAAGFGRRGFALVWGTMLLAVFTTLLSALRGAERLLGSGTAALLLMLLTACAGFRGAVELVYPALGGVCFALLASERIRSCFSSA